MNLSKFNFDKELLFRANAKDNTMNLSKLNFDKELLFRANAKDNTMNLSKLNLYNYNIVIIQIIYTIKYCINKIFI
jgi:hypothetical protein